MAGLERVKKAAIALLLAISVSCLFLSSCEGDALSEPSSETNESSAEETTVWETEAATQAPDGDALPNLPEDGYTKIY